MSKLFIVVISILILITSVDNSYSSSVTIQFDKEQYDSDASIVITVINPAESNQVEIQVSSFTGLNYHLYADELEDTLGIFQVVLPISLFLINNDDVITASYEYVDQVTSVPVIITTQAKIIKIDKQIIHESQLVFY